MRFTPDGKQIICYNTTAQEIKVYWYNGVTSIRNPTGPNAESLFTGHFSVQIHRFERGVNLCRDLCLVTDDSKHLILAYTVPVPEQQVNLQKVRKNNESMIPNGTMEHTVFVSIDLNVS
jgi:hypothetical protein